MIGVIRKDRISDEYVISTLDMVSIVGKMRKNRLRWFKHFMKKEDIEWVRVIMQIDVDKSENQK